MWCKCAVDGRCVLGRQLTGYCTCNKDGVIVVELFRSFALVKVAKPHYENTSLVKTSTHSGPCQCFAI